MEDQLVSFETAKLAYEKGYPVFNNLAKSNFYNRRTGTKIYFGRTGQQNENHLYGRPAQSLLQKWLREEHEVHICVDIDLRKKWYVNCYMTKNKVSEIGQTYDSLSEIVFDTYEEALEKGLQESLKLLR